jgi:hypothetical protein
MGNKHTKCSLKKKEIAEHVANTHCETTAHRISSNTSLNPHPTPLTVDAAEIKLLNEHFRGISASVEDDDVIDKEYVIVPIFSSLLNY